MKRGLLLIGLCLIAFILGGCTKTTPTGYHPQSHFDFPNSNVVPLGHVAGSASTTKFLTGFPMITGDMQEEAVSDALAHIPGADNLINYTSTQKYTNLWLIQVLTYKVEGTAVKSELGYQKLN